MHKPKLRKLKLLGVALATALSSFACASGSKPPKAPDIEECMIDLERGHSICFTIVSEQGPRFVPITEMDKWSCKSPEDKAKYDNWIKELKRRWEQFMRQLEQEKASRK